MDVSTFKKILTYQEPSFGYNGKEYSICSPDGKFYVTAEDSLKDVDLVFHTADALLDGWIIQGRQLRDIIPNIELN